MQIFVASKGQRLGPFGLRRVTELLDDGELSPDDLGWHADIANWTPLSEIPALMAAIETKREHDFVRESNKPLDTGKNKSSNSTSNKKNKKEAWIASDQSSTGGGDPVQIEPVPSRMRTADELRDAAAAATDNHTKPRPVARFWARIFDYLLVVLVVYAVVGAPQLPGMDGNVTFTEMMNGEYWEKIRTASEQPEFRRISNAHVVGLVLWTILEGLLIAQFGTTPGKWLLNLRVTNAAGIRPSTQQSLLRSLYVWFLGVGMWIPMLSLGTMLFGLYSLMSRGTTLWDRNLGTRVQQGRMTLPRILLAIAAFFAILLAQQALALR